MSTSYGKMQTFQFQFNLKRLGCLKLRPVYLKVTLSALAPSMNKPLKPDQNITIIYPYLLACTIKWACIQLKYKHSLQIITDYTIYSNILRFIITGLSHSQQYKMSILKPSHATSNMNNLSTMSDRRPKYPAFISSMSKSLLKFDNMGLNSQENMQLIKISVKKQTDRRNKLKKILEKYASIYTQERKHVKAIKASIIEMKDANSAAKLKILLDPTILVQNSIKIETREFLCTLMNTFYKTYEGNQKNNYQIGSLTNNLSFLIKGISYNEDMIFLMQKTQINEQVQLEGELLAQKNRIKQELQKKKQIKELHDCIKDSYQQGKQKHERKKNTIAELKKKLKQLTEQSQSLKRGIEYQQNMKTECKGKIDAQVLHQQKMNNQLQILTKQTNQKQAQSKKMLRKLLQCRVLQADKQVKKIESNKTVGQQTKQRIKYELKFQFEHLRG